METRPRGDVDSMVIPKEEVRRIIEALDREMGFVPDPTATIERLRERMEEEGIRPEDNGASRELYRMRYGDNWKEDWPEE